MRSLGYMTVCGLLATAMWASPAEAVLYGFTNITGNNAVNAAAGEAQLFVDVTDPGAGQTRLTFTNVGAIAMSITDIYVDDDGGNISGIASILNGPGVNFVTGAAPPNLPGGAGIGFSANFAAESSAPPTPNGVNPGETVAITFNLLGGVTFNDVIADINAALLRIGIHVQGFANGGSEAFVNTTPNPVPAPGAALLGLIGLGAVTGFKRRQSATR
jgi:hypothetical protein